MTHMRSAEQVRAGVALWDIAVPSQSGRLSGVTMAGFRDRAEELVDLQVVPHPAVTLVIDLGEGIVVDDASGESKRGSVAAGLAPGSVRGRGRNIECLQVRLSPVAAHALLDTYPDLGATVVSLEDLWGRDATRTEEQLRAAASWDDRFMIMEMALTRSHGGGRPVDPEVAFAWQQMVTSRGRVRVQTLAAQVGWSRKRLWSRFGSQVGLTPKRAAELIRFDHAAHRLAAGHRPALVAADAGYTDQSHLHRDTMTFAGATPSAVAAAPWLAVDDVAWEIADRRPIPAAAASTTGHPGR
jgi:AraC-like DNA-binding protein